MPQELKLNLRKSRSRMNTGYEVREKPVLAKTHSRCLGRNMIYIATYLSRDFYQIESQPLIHVAKRYFGFSLRCCRNRHVDLAAISRHSEYRNRGLFTLGRDRAAHQITPTLHERGRSKSVCCRLRSWRTIPSTHIEGLTLESDNEETLPNQRHKAALVLSRTK
jgi:hypothetical protein